MLPVELLYIFSILVPKNSNSSVTLEREMCVFIKAVDKFFND